MLDFIIGICRFDTQFEYQSIDFVHNKGDFDVFLQRVAYNSLSIDHDLERYKCWYTQLGEAYHTPSTTSTTRTIPSANLTAQPTSSTKLTCPGVSMRWIKWDFPAVVDNTRDIGDDLMDISLSLESVWVSVYRTYKICERLAGKETKRTNRFVRIPNQLVCLKN